jgi:DNA-binding NtrC family response regulator
MNTGTNLLIVGPDLILYDLIRSSPLGERYTVHYCSIYEDIFAFIRDNQIRVSILDLEKAGKDAQALLGKIKKFDPLIDVIIVGRPLAADRVLDWIHQGATDYLARPLELGTVEQVLEKICEKRSLRRETYLLEKKLEKKYNFQGMVSKNLYMQEIFGLTEKISRHFHSVLITGETGTGKEMIARAIHRLSPREGKKLVICDCTAIPDNLFESELFGYAKGAFSGADKDKRGLFEEADKGVIFLDEIGEIPFTIQAKLLRVLETQQFRPLGSTEEKKIDVRIIAATNRDLREAIKKKQFREDLFHRLNKVEIHVPPLREKLEDIPLLVRHFLQKFNKKYDKEVKGVSREVQKLFLNYGWPGNIRELENVLESTLMVIAKDFIDVADLPKYLRESQSSRRIIPFISPEKLSTLENLEKEYISYLLRMTGNNLRQTAKVLGISRTTLYNKMSRFGLTR